MIREYLDTPKDQVFSKHFENDVWGLSNILKAADRRFGTRRLVILKHRIKNQAAQKIIQKRLHLNYGQEANDEN